MFVKVAGVSLSVVRGPRLDILHWGMERPGSGPQVLRPASDPPSHLPVSKAQPTFSPLPNRECITHSSLLGNTLFTNIQRLCGDQGAHHRKDLGSRQGLLPSPLSTITTLKKIPPLSYNSQCIFRAAADGPGPSKDHCAFSITTFIMLSDINTALRLICLT